MVFLFAVTGRAETFFAYLNGAQEVPGPVTTTGTGYARVFLNETAGTISFTVVFNNFQGNQTASHIHTGGLGIAGPVTINLGAVGGTSGTISGNAAITPAQINLMRTHQFYVNVHSSTFPAGEIRGQLGIKRPVDFDGDGRQDLSILRFATTGTFRQITYWNRNSTTGDLTQPWGNSVTDTPTPGDYDGDGRDDLSVFRNKGQAVGAQLFFYVFRSSDNTVQYIKYGVTGDLPACRDFDGDGITDPAIFRRGAALNDQAVWWIQQSTTGTDRVENFGTSNLSTLPNDQDFPVPGDYDGDGKFDIAVYRAGTLAPANTFIILNSSNRSVRYEQFGSFTTDYIIPGDYDGDGKYDLAVARTGASASTPLEWYILQSSNGQVRARSFGVSTDFPAQGDYDGDARADIAIYRRGANATADSSFWINRSFDNVDQQIIWGKGSTSTALFGPDYALAQFDSR